jgi:hypothetical protein
LTTDCETSLGKDFAIVIIGRGRGQFSGQLRGQIGPIASSAAERLIPAPARDRGVIAR